MRIRAGKVKSPTRNLKKGVKRKRNLKRIFWKSERQRSKKEF
jgi:hypothetical protein